MCLIVDKPAGVPVPREYLENGIENNPDGWGLMFSREGRLTILRGLDPDEFWRAWDGDTPPDVRVGVHFRWATHGSKSLDNVHPFEHGEFATMHNGVIDIDRSADPNRSDTWHYVQECLAPWLDQYPDGVEHPELVEPHVRGSRLLIFRSDGAAARVNGDAGIVRDGVWYSNRDNFEAWRSGYGSFGRPWSDWGTTDAWSDPLPYRADTSDRREALVTEYLNNVARKQGSRAARKLAYSLVSSKKEHVWLGAWRWLDDDESPRVMGRVRV